MSSLITSLSSITCGSPKSSDFYSKLKSILSPASFNENFSRGSLTPSFSEWKRKVRCISESDYVAQSKSENQRPRTNHMENDGLLKDYLGISTNMKVEQHLNSSYTNRFAMIDPISSNTGSSIAKKSIPHDLYPLTCSQSMYYQEAQTPQALPVALASVFQAKSQTENVITTSKSVNSTQDFNDSIDNSATSNGNKTICKRNSSGHRKNIWKNQTYADLICKAILSSPGKRLTLSQIYEWLIENIDYFKAKKGGKSSIGWKNSIRHNLSLHSRFVRIQGHESGKSSWWTVDLTAKSSRRCKRKTLLGDSNKSVLRLPSTSSIGSQLPTFFRYQIPYDGYVTGDRFHSQSSFYEQGKDGWTSDYNSHKTFPPQNVASSDNRSSFPPCYFPYSDPYSCCYSGTFLPNTFVQTSCYTFGGNDDNYNYYYNRIANNDRSITSTRYPSSSQLNQYNDYFNIRNSTGFQLPDSSPNLPVISTNNRNAVGDNCGKTLPSLFSTLYNNINSTKGIQQQMNVDDVSKCDYKTSSRYDYSIHKTSSLDDGSVFSNYDLKKCSSGFHGDLKVNRSEA